MPGSSQCRAFIMAAAPPESAAYSAANNKNKRIFAFLLVSGQKLIYNMMVIIIWEGLKPCQTNLISVQWYLTKP